MVKNSGALNKLIFYISLTVLSGQNAFSQTSAAETAFDNFIKNATDTYYVVSLAGKITDPTAAGNTTVIAIKGVSATGAKPTIKQNNSPDTCVSSGYNSKLGAVTASMQTPAAYLAGVNFVGELFAMNANYFDVTAQIDKSGKATSWQATNCSMPLGNYYANGNISKNSAAPTSFGSGTLNFIDSTGSNITPLSSLSISYKPQSATLAVNGIYNPAASTGSSTFDYSNVTKGLTTDFQNIASAGSGQLTVVSGVNLIPGFTASINGIDQGAADGVDSGQKNTTRIALGYISGTDTLIVVEGGSYTTGYSRSDLVGIMKNLGVKYAMEFDGGGSAGLAITTSAFTWYSGDATGKITKASGAPTNNSCSTTPLIYCTPVTLSTGAARPSPSWLVWFKG